MSESKLWSVYLRPEASEIHGRVIMPCAAVVLGDAIELDGEGGTDSLGGGEAWMSVPLEQSEQRPRTSSRNKH